MSLLWHYTTVQKLDSIVHSGAIQPSAPPRERDEKPVVWFSSRPDWDPTANPVVAAAGGRTRRYATLDETIVVGGGLARIGVAAEVAPHDWKAYKRLSGVSPRRAKAMYDRALALGSRPSSWFVSFAAVPRQQWQAVEVCVDGQWLADSRWQ
ncbi:MAG: hypothetical protein J5I93_19310 [Pirellulaceae bacterium]|nr:hypothetical protein [Pirellulaceae bacterium]